MSSSISSLRRIGIGALLFAGMTLQAMAQGANRLEGITFTTGAGNKVELTLRLSDTAPTPLTFTVDNPARIALDLPDTTVSMASRRVDVKTGVVDTVNVAEAGGRTRVVLNVDNLVPYETKISGNTIIVSVSGGSSARTSGTAVSTAAAAAASQTTRSAAPVSGTRSVSNIDFRRRCRRLRSRRRRADRFQGARRPAPGRWPRGREFRQDLAAREPDAAPRRHRLRDAGQLRRRAAPSPTARAW